MRNRIKSIAAIVGLAILLLLPLMLSPFHLVLLTEILLMGLFALSFNLLFGYTGLLSFGHAAYFATGAYVCAYLIKSSIPFLLAVAVGVMAALVVAAVLGYFSVRLDEIYFAMLTLAFGMMVFTIVFQWREVTGGSDGISGVLAADLGIPGLAVNIQGFTNYYYVCALAFVVTIILLWRITHSPFGELLQASRENSDRLIFTGVDLRRLRWIAFAIAGGWAGLAGALWAPFQRVASPDIAHWTFSAMPVLMTILGGARSFAGPLVGAAVFLVLEHIIQSNQRYFWQWLASAPLLPATLADRQLDLWHFFLGLLLIPLILGFRGGLTAYIDKLVRGWSGPLTLRGK
ncbi:MAG: branched-chain amino acid ABC transporter permease [Leptolyngbyaceae cyanobacterium MO_188.B28]|nr:branched-chain amino acid ABC transporter permease [Leptolyngbyaceae cyanobacterium MO_188.B28]